MMSPEKHKSSGVFVLRSNLHRSISPSGRFCSSTISSSSSAFTSSSSSISGFSSSTRSTSPSRITVRGGGYFSPSPPTVRFSIDHRHKSPGRSVAKNFNRNFDRDSNGKKAWSHGSKKTCLCSPTTHPGSFRCSLHKNSNSTNSDNDSSRDHSTVSYRSHRLYARRSAMTNSLVRIGTVEGDLVKRALAALIRPSSHQQRRRSDFRPRPSRLSVMSKADE